MRAAPVAMRDPSAVFPSFPCSPTTACFRSGMMRSREEEFSFLSKNSSSAAKHLPFCFRTANTGLPTSRCSAHTYIQDSRCTNRGYDDGVFPSNYCLITSLLAAPSTDEEDPLNQTPNPTLPSTLSCRAACLLSAATVLAPLITTYLGR